MRNTNRGAGRRTGPAERARWPDADGRNGRGVGSLWAASGGDDDRDGGTAPVRPESRGETKTKKKNGRGGREKNDGENASSTIVSRTSVSFVVLVAAAAAACARARKSFRLPERQQYIIINFCFSGYKLIRDVLRRGTAAVRQARVTSRRIRNRKPTAAAAVAGRRRGADGLARFAASGRDGRETIMRPDAELKTICAPRHGGAMNRFSAFSGTAAGGGGRRRGGFRLGGAIRGGRLQTKLERPQTQS